MIARRKRASRGRRQEYSYSPMIWVNDGENRRQIWGGTFRTKAEAKAEERRLLDERDAGKNLKAAKITVAELFDQYINDKRNKVKASTLQRSEELLAHLRPIIGYRAGYSPQARDDQQGVQHAARAPLQAHGTALPLAASRCSRPRRELGADRHQPSRASGAAGA